MTTPKIISAEYFADATESYSGFCTTCQDFTREQTEPDATGYKCPDCKQLTVVGAEHALIVGLIDVEEGGSDD